MPAFVHFTPDSSGAQSENQVFLPTFLTAVGRRTTGDGKRITRKVIAWRVGCKADTQFVVDTVEEAFLKRGRPQSMLFHSDRGSPYTSERFRRFLDERNIVQSFSAAGYPYDNAVVESFFKFLKKEELNRRRFRNPEELKRSAFVYIKGFYNTKRPHSANGNLSPDEKEAALKKQNNLIA